MKIAIDFDGTCVMHEYPAVGSDVPHAAHVLKRLADAGHQLILYTMRSGVFLGDAVDWFDANEIPLHAVQKDPGQNLWTASNKCFANLYIDDAALGCPLIYDVHTRPFVDWVQAEKLLIEMGAL